MVIYTFPNGKSIVSVEKYFDSSKPYTFHLQPNLLPCQDLIYHTDHILDIYASITVAIAWGDLHLIGPPGMSQIMVKFRPWGVCQTARVTIYGIEAMIIRPDIDRAIRPYRQR